MSDKEFTFKEVADHNTKKDLYVIIHDKVYDSSAFVDEHPGGEEVLLDVGGQDATEAFEDVGHSDEAREILEGMKVGSLKRVPGDPEPKKASTDKVSAGPGGSSDSGFGVGLYAIILIGGLAAYLAFTFTQNKEGQ